MSPIPRPSLRSPKGRPDAQATSHAPRTSPLEPQKTQRKKIAARLRSSGRQPLGAIIPYRQGMIAQLWGQLPNHAPAKHLRVSALRSKFESHPAAEAPRPGTPGRGFVPVRQSPPNGGLRGQRARLSLVTPSVNAPPHSARRGRGRGLSVKRRAQRGGRAILHATADARIPLPCFMAGPDRWR